MSATLSSKRYAQAAFEIAKGNNKLEEWLPDLNKIAELTHDPEVVYFLENTKIPFESKAKLVKEALDGISPLALNLAYLLIAKGKAGSAVQIASEYQRLVDEYHGIKHAEITTVVPLDDSSRKMLSQRLEAMIGKKVSIELQVNPDILGGFIARIGDSLIDFSIRNRLDLLKKELVETTR
jgi:F-type H+-transporting ATPase subunit delta